MATPTGTMRKVLAQDLNTLDANGILSSEPWFKNWRYTPRQISFEQALSNLL
jgi:hypothetical protein